MVPFFCRFYCRHSAMAGANGAPSMVSQASTSNIPWSSSTSISSVIVSCIILSTSYYKLSPRWSNAKQSAWILTTISSAIMSLVSLPFLYDYFVNGGNVKYIRTLPNFAIAANRFFQSYLVVDLTVGFVYYRSQIGLLTGWIHHGIYLMIVELAIRRSWAHIFCLCAAMEVPTFFLGFMTLYPELRSNVVFAVAFFLTRILFHIVLGVSYFLQDNRTHATGGSLIPSLLLASIFPLHAMWFYGCIKGFIRRASKRHTPVPTKGEPDVKSVDTQAKVAQRLDLQTKRPLPKFPKLSDNRYYARLSRSVPSPQFPAIDLKLEHSKLHSRRFYSRSMSLNSNDSRTSVTGTFKTKLYASDRKSVV